MIAVRGLLARENRLQQHLARRRSVMDAIKTLWESRVDPVWTL